jgi:hypothetical protein
MAPLAAAALLALGPGSASATTSIQVTDASTDAPLSSSAETARKCESTDASHGCTLRAAVELANLLAPSTVTIAVPAGTFTDSLGTLTIEEGAQVTLAGAGASKSIIDGGGVASVLTVKNGAALSVEDVTIRDGHGENGGGIDTNGVAGVTVDRSMIVDNTATHDGGGILSISGLFQPVIAQGAPSPDGVILQGEPSELTVERSTIAHNTAGEDGGGIFESAAIGPIINSTIAENHAGEEGGGIYAVATLDTLIGDTLYDNTASRGEGENITTGFGTMMALSQTIVAQPAGSGHQNCEMQSASTIGSFLSGAGYNLDNPSVPNLNLSGFDMCGMGEAEHDLLDIDPKLDPSGLKDNGGPTETLALLGPASGAASPAIDAVPAASCVGPAGPSEPITEDQRGAQRPDPGGGNASCDVGAYEFSPTTVTPACTTPSPVSAGQQATVVCTIEKGNGKYATGTAATFTLPGGATLDSATPSQGSCNGTACALGTIDPATVTIVLSPTSSGTLGFSASDAETGSKQTSVNVTVNQPAAPVVTLTPKAAAKCVSLRDFKIHIQNVKQLKIVSANVYVNGHLKQTLKGRALTATINLRGLPKGTVIVKIVARTRTGRKLTGRRTYHTCTKKLPGHKHLFL